MSQFIGKAKIGCEVFTRDPGDRLVSAAFVVLWIATLTSLFGYVVFTLNPSNLAWHPWIPVIYQYSYGSFAQLQIALSFLLALLILRKLPIKIYAPALVFSVLISAGFELSGTTTGLPFGAYTYTDLLGSKIAGHVPFLIPTSWFVMSLCSYSITRRLWPDVSVIQKLLLASLIMTSWDFTLDPAMSFLTPYWIWAEPGFFYGMPMLNLFGWFVTSMVIATVFHGLKIDHWLNQISENRLTHLYLVNLALPVGLILLSKLWLAFAATFAFWILLGVLRFWRWPLGFANGSRKA